MNGWDEVEVERFRERVRALEAGLGKLLETTIVQLWDSNGFWDECDHCGRAGEYYKSEEDRRDIKHGKDCPFSLLPGVLKDG